MINNTHILKPILALILGLSMGLAQAVNVSGTVSDTETGESLAGAQVFVKGTFTGTTTDINGHYSLDLPGDATLMVAYIGYKTQEAAPSGETLDFNMAPDVLKQDEVIVTGLATSVKRRNLANAVAVVSGDELVNAPTQTLDGALAGKFAGVNIRRNTGAPGGGINVNLRGSSTLTGGTQPLYVIDGVIYNNDANQSGIDVVTAAAGAGSSRPQGQPTNRIGDINPNDIESIEVLKGASAAAIYGAKASNGVIIIKTKRGKNGKTRFSFSQRMGTSSLLKKMGHRSFETFEEAYGQFGAGAAHGMTGGTDAMQADIDAYDAAYAVAEESFLTENPDSTFAGDHVPANLQSISAYDSGFYSSYEAYWAGRDLDYEQLVYGETGQLKESTLSITGGDANTQFYFGGQYMDEGGIIKNTGYEKLSGRVNVDHRFSDKAKLSITTNLSRTSSDRGVTGNDNTNLTLGFSIGFTPSFIDIQQNADGSFPSHPMNPSNPLETVEYFVNNELTHRATGSAQFDYSLMRNSSMSLAFLAVAAADFYNQENTVFSPSFTQIESGKTEAGQSVMTATDNLNTNMSLNLVHKMKTGSMKLNTTAGMQYETYDWNSLFVHATGMIPTQTNVDKASAQSVYHDRKKQQDRGILIQEEIGIGDNIHLSFGARGDKSSTMGNTETYQWYPKMAASYQFGEVAGIFDNLKLRLANGQTGNMPSSSAKYTTMSSANIGGINGLVQSSLKGNSDIRPERTAETEFGTDFSIMGGFANVEATMYTQKITDLILQVDMPASSGATSKWENGGEMETKGTELSVTLNPTKLVSLGGLDWTFRTNYYTTSSTVTKLNVDPYNYGGFATFLGTYRIQEGWSPTAIIGSDLDADGNYIELGNETPDYQVSFFNAFKMGDIDFSFLIDHKEGGAAINLANLIYDLGGTTADYEENGGSRLGGLGATTVGYVESTTYTMLREINLTYTLPSNLSDSFGLGYARVGLSGRNLWMDTDYTGLSPEVSQFGSEAVGGSVDTNPFPQSKSMYFSLSIGF